MRKSVQMVIGDKNTSSHNYTELVIVCPHFEDPKNYLQLTQDNRTIIISKDDINDLVDAIKDLQLNHMI